MRKTHLLFIIIRRSGTYKALMSFLALYVLCALVVYLFEPSISGYLDALWFLWAVSTTVGLGDFTAITVVGRTATVICSIAAILTTAIVTGVVVDFFNERRQQQLDRSVTEFMDKLEHLPDLSEDELKNLSDRVKALRK